MKHIVFCLFTIGTLSPTLSRAATQQEIEDSAMCTRYFWILDRYNQSETIAVLEPRVRFETMRATTIGAIQAAREKTGRYTHGLEVTLLLNQLQGLNLADQANADSLQTLTGFCLAWTRKMGDLAASCQTDLDQMTLGSNYAMVREFYLKCLPQPTVSEINAIQDTLDDAALTELRAIFEAWAQDEYPKYGVGSL